MSMLPLFTPYFLSTSVCWSLLKMRHCVPYVTWECLLTNLYSYKLHFRERNVFFLVSMLSALPKLFGRLPNLGRLPYLGLLTEGMCQCLSSLQELGCWEEDTSMRKYGFEYPFCPAEGKTMVGFGTT